MWSKFAKNGVLTGQVDAYCLVCEYYFRNEETASSHIEKPAHVKKLNSVGYYDKYSSDYIRKVNNGYFCGFCNLLLSTAAKLKLHIVETTHNNNKGVLLLKRLGNDVIAFDNICIREDSWHGLIEDTCVICNVEFEDKDDHKNEHVHVLKLIQNKVMFGPARSVYRKVDDNSFQCLTCNNVFFANSLNEHFNTTDHQTASKRSEIGQKQVSNDVDNSTGNDSQGLTAPSKIKQSENIEKTPCTTTDVKKNDEDVIFSNKKTKEDFNSDIRNPDSHDTSKGKDVDLDEIYCEILGAKDYTIQLEDKSLFCILCHVTVCSPIVEHLNSKHHQAMHKLHKDRIAEKMCKGSMMTSQSEGKGQINKPEIEIVKQSVAKESKKSSSINSDDRSKILDSVSTFQKNEVNIDFITETAFCKRCTTNIDFDFDAINIHIDGHKKSDKIDKKLPFESGVKASGSNQNLYTKPVFMARDSETNKTLSTINIDKLAKDNGMIMKIGNKMHCKRCDVEVPANVNNIKEHIKGNNHKSKSSSQVSAQASVKNVPKNKYAKQLVKEFIKHITGVEKDGENFFIINEKFCIPGSNLLLVGKHISRGIGCLACNINLNELTYKNHIQSETHIKAFDSSYVITSLDSEFVREIKPGVYHCGFCNYVEDDWESMEEHLTTSDHKKIKRVAEWQLQEELTAIRTHRAQKEMEFALFMRMFGMSPMFMPNMFGRNRFDSDSD